MMKFTPQPRVMGKRWVATSFHLALLPELLPVIAQSMTPRCIAGTISLKDMVTGVPPAAAIRAEVVVEKTRIFLPARSSTSTASFMLQQRLREPPSAGASHRCRQCPLRRLAR